MGPPISKSFVRHQLERRKRVTCQSFVFSPLLGCISRKACVLVALGFGWMKRLRGGQTPILDDEGICAIRHGISQRNPALDATSKMVPYRFRSHPVSTFFLPSPYETGFFISRRRLQHSNCLSSFSSRKAAVKHTINNNEAWGMDFRNTTITLHITQRISPEILFDFSVDSKQGCGRRREEGRGV